MKIKKLLVIAPEYPADDLPKTTTPVVHYFCKEWKKQGVEVLVINYISNFPEFYYSIVRPFVGVISSKEGFQIRTSTAKEYSYIKDNVQIKRIALNKIVPHSRYSSKEIKKAADKTVEYCNKIGFKPDFVIGHWFDPCVEIIAELKHVWTFKCGVSLHGCGDKLLSKYGDDFYKLFKNLDIIGFRSYPIQTNFNKLFDVSIPGFVCPSGIPDAYISKSNREYNRPIRSFAFVGTHIKRKYPAEIIPAVNMAFHDEDFEIRYIGTGIESNRILNYAKKYNIEENIRMYGRKQRTEVIDLLKNTDVLVMNSKDETFGLVYLEAMAVGCIVIASKNEGFDGIIKDGINGFLCKAGDISDLSKTIVRIKNLSTAQLNEISNNAILTAQSLTESIVAKDYLNNLNSVM